MFFLMSEKEKEHIEEIQEITSTDYEITGDMIKADNVFVALEDLLYEYNNLKEEFEDYKERQSMTSDDYYVDTYIDEERLKNFEF